MGYVLIILYGIIRLSLYGIIFDYLTWDHYISDMGLLGLMTAWLIGCR